MVITAVATDIVNFEVVFDALAGTEEKEVDHVSPERAGFCCCGRLQLLLLCFCHVQRQTYVSCTIYIHIDDFQ
jgi:hypothetical protein